MAAPKLYDGLKLTTVKFKSNGNIMSSCVCIYIIIGFIYWVHILGLAHYLLVMSQFARENGP